MLDAHRAEQLHLVAAGLGDESLGEVGAADAVRESRVVVDSLGDARLTAETAALDHDRVDALPRRVDRGREPRRAATDDREVVALLLCLERQAELAASSSLVGSMSTSVPSKTIVGIDRPPFCNSSTCCSPAASWSMSTQS